jgi:CDP-diacylglycerol pyrophosphatase
MTELPTLENKGSQINCLENLYIQLYQQRGIVIDKQNTGEFNPLRKIMHDKHAHVQHHIDHKIFVPCPEVSTESSFVVYT